MKERLSTASNSVKQLGNEAGLKALAQGGAPQRLFAALMRQHFDAIDATIQASVKDAPVSPGMLADALATFMANIIVRSGGIAVDDEDGLKLRVFAAYAHERLAVCLKQAVDRNVEPVPPAGGKP